MNWTRRGSLTLELRREWPPYKIDDVEVYMRATYLTRLRSAVEDGVAELSAAYGMGPPGN